MKKADTNTYKSQAEELLAKHGGDVQKTCEAYLATIVEWNDDTKKIMATMIKKRLQQVVEGSDSNVLQPLITLLKEVNLMRGRIAGDSDALKPDLLDIRAIEFAKMPYPVGKEGGFELTKFKIIKDKQGNPIAFTCENPTIKDIIER